MENLGNKSIVLMGLKHCGKSTHGRLLAQKWGFSFFDTDEVMEQLCGMPVRALYEKNGVVDFMRVEEEACCKIMSENEGKTFVISTGGKLIFKRKVSMQLILLLLAFWGLLIR